MTASRRQLPPLLFLGILLSIKSPSSKTKPSQQTGADGGPLNQAVDHTGQTRIATGGTYHVIGCRTHQVWLSKLISDRL